MELKFKDHDEALKALSVAQSNPDGKRYHLRLDAGTPLSPYFLWYIAPAHFNGNRADAISFRLDTAIVRLVRISSRTEESEWGVVQPPIKLKHLAIVEHDGGSQ